MTESPSVTVVDDDQQVRESLAELLHSVDLDVECYASGQEFLDNYSHQRPGCVVLDLRMPQKSGLDVLEELSSRQISVPVIMITGHGDIPAAVAAMKQGAVDFFEKPYRGAALLESVRRAIELDQRNLRQQAERSIILTRYQTLTPDEKEVLRYTVEGKPDKAIALRLDLSLRTIQLRRASLMRKMQAASRAALIRLAQVIEGTLPAE